MEARDEVLMQPHFITNQQISIVNLDDLFPFQINKPKLFYKAKVSHHKLSL